MIRMLWGTVFGLLSLFYIILGYGAWATRESFANSPVAWTDGIYFFLIPGAILLTGVVGLLANKTWSPWPLRIGLIGCAAFPATRLPVALSHPEVGHAGIIGLMAPLAVLAIGFLSTFLISRGFEQK
ncbi:MAG: hypothetical protein IT289_00925 [Oligoflexia bacterium]|nr:hypothetical protein [Oligoflexia bacterium]